VQLPDRRQNRRAKLRWEAAGTVYVDVGFGWVDGHWLPLEVFLVAGKTGTALNLAAHDVAELLSLLLQHGYAIEDLQKRFKPGSLAAFACAAMDEIDRAFREEGA
jgi:hypothetical protein